MGLWCHANLLCLINLAHKTLLYYKNNHTLFWQPVLIINLLVTMTFVCYILPLIFDIFDAKTTLPMMMHRIVHQSELLCAKCFKKACCKGPMMHLLCLPELLKY